MNLPTILGLILVTGGSTTLGSLPVLFHHLLKDKGLAFWESFGGGVMLSASVFSLFLPALKMLKESGVYSPFYAGVILGMLTIFLLAWLFEMATENIFHQRAFLFVFVMALHNIPEGLAVGVDVAALGWKNSLPLTIAIFIQNLPEGLASSMSFLVAGFRIKKALLANFVTAVIETFSSFLGFTFVSDSLFGLPFLLSFSGACMMSVVLREIFVKVREHEAAKFSRGGFLLGLCVCAVLDIVL